MACGCKSSSKPSKTTPCDCGGGVAPTSAAGAPGERQADVLGIPASTRATPTVRLGDTRRVSQLVPTPGGEASSRAESPRSEPIGVRPVVPERPPFEVLFRPDNLSQVDAILFDAFRGLDSNVQRDLAARLQTLPAATLPGVHDYLLTFPDLGMRVGELYRVIDSNGQVPSSVPAPAAPPVVPVSISVTPRWPVFQVAPPPSPQIICLTNGFDRRWGQPPSTYKGVALRFDSGQGAYAFDEAYALASSPTDGNLRPLYNEYDLNDIRQRYELKLALVPFKRTQSSAWEFRWETPSSTPRVDCVPA